jgi:hypothetical protein
MQAMGQWTRKFELYGHKERGTVASFPSFSFQIRPAPPGWSSALLLRLYAKQRVESALDFVKNPASVLDRFPQGDLDDF